MDSSEAHLLLLEKWKKIIDEKEIKKVNIETIRQWLMMMGLPKQDGFIDWKNDSIEEGMTMLLCAIKYERLDIAKLLLEHGADITIGDNDGSNALMNACYFGGHTTIVNLLLDMGADINIADKNGNTALIFASYGGHTKIADLLLDKGVDIAVVNMYGNDALLHASMGGYIHTVKLLLDKGADIAIANIYGNTAVILAACDGHSDTVELLLDKGADAAITNESGDTALILASTEGHMDTVELLLDRKADVTIVNNYGNSALILASDKGHTKTVNLLLDKGANIDFGNEHGNTALILASCNGHIDTVELLLDKGANIAIVNDYGNSALILASSKGHTRTAELLLDNGADLKFANEGGYNALILASYEGHINTVELLLGKGADLNIFNKYGDTALILASDRGHADTVELLLDTGADLNIFNDYGNTALTCASYNGHNDVVKLLLYKGADIAIANKDGETALSLANEAGHTEIVGLLMERSLSLDIGSLLDAGVTSERLEELYPKEEVRNVVLVRIGEQREEEANRAGRPAAAAFEASRVEVGDEENVQVPTIPDASKIESSRSLDIGTLLDAGAPMEKLEEIYPKEEVHKVAQARIVKQTKEEDEIQRRRRGSMARLLFLHAKSTALKEVLKNSAVMDQVLVSLLADPEEKILMCPLMLTRLKDPVVICSGFVMDRSTALDENGNLRIQLCPFSRKVLSLPVYPCIPIRSKLKAWEAERMNCCIEVAEKMVESKEWEHATRVFDIAETLLQEMGDKTYLNLARKLANLERKIDSVCRKRCGTNGEDPTTAHPCTERREIKGKL